MGKKSRIRFDSISSGYLSLWRELKGWRLFAFYALHYTLLFAVMQHVIFLPFAREGKSFAWIKDGAAQHYARLIYIRQIWKESVDGLLSGNGGHLPLYDFRNGPALFDTQIGLPQLFAIFWPDGRYDTLYRLLALGSYYWMGLTFSVFGFFFKQKPLPVLTGAISYTFCGMAIFAGIRQPHLVVPMVFLPVLLIGAERIVRGERALVFVLAVFLSLTTQFGVYTSCMQAVFVILYIVLRFIDVYHEDRGRQAFLLLRRLLVWGGVPVLLAAASWLPALLEIAGTNRVGNSATLMENMLSYDKGYYARFMGDFLLNPSGVGFWNRLGFSVLTLPAVVILFVRHRKNERSMRLSFLVLTVMLCIPAVGYIMSGLSNVSNRFCFAYAFCTAAILMFMLPHVSQLTSREWAAAGAVVAVYCGTAVFLGLREYFDARSAVIALAAIACLGLCHALGVRARGWSLAALAITCLSVCYSAHWYYSEKGYVNEFYPSPDNIAAAGQYASLGSSAPIKEDDTFYRVAGNRISDVEINLAFRYGLNGLSMFPYYGWSNAYMQWIAEMEIPREDARQYLNSRTPNAAVLALSAVKYYALREGSGMPRPYGFTQTDRVRNGNDTDIILRNDHALPVGYAYQQYMTRDTYDSLNGLGRQEAQLQAVLLEEAPSLPGLTGMQPQPTAKQIPYELEADGVRWQDGLLFVEKNGGTLTLSFAGLPGAETYLRIADHTSVNNEVWTIWARSGDVSVPAVFYTDTDVYAHHQHTQTLNFGYSEEGLTEITLTFPFESLWRLADLQIWCQPMDAYAAQVAALADETLQNVATDWHSLKGDITVAGDRMLALSIPYTDGWTAYVDGAKTKLYQANTGFMAVELTEGTHKVELRYMLPGLRAGLAMCAAGAVGLAALLVCGRRKKRNAAL